MLGKTPGSLATSRGHLTTGKFNKVLYLLSFPEYLYAYLYLLGGNSRTLPERIKFDSVLSHICIKKIRHMMYTS